MKMISLIEEVKLVNEVLRFIYDLESVTKKT